MTFFNEFGKKWASEGSVEPISETQKKAGWDFLGSVPPISGQFNLVQQNTDEKINYLFNLINSFVISKGGTLNAVSTNALRDILNNLLIDNAVMSVNDINELVWLDSKPTGILSGDWLVGQYSFKEGDYSGLVSNDPLHLVSIPPQGETGITGAWLREKDPHDFNTHGQFLRKRKVGITTSRVNNIAAPTVGILGDSISHGAFSRDIFRNNWTNIVKRALLHEYNSNSYGFQNIVSSMGNGDTLSSELVTVTRSGGSHKVHSDAQDSISGYFWESVTTDDSLSFSVDAHNRYAGVWYLGQSGGGTFSVEINGVQSHTVNTGAVTGNIRFLFTTVDDGSGKCNVIIRNANGAKISISGIELVANNEGHAVVENWSYSGRRLRWMSQTAIAQATKVDALIFALGHNDATDAENDEAYFAEVRQRIDWIIDNVRLNGTQLYVLDFVWARDRTSRVRNELLRLHKSVPTSRYIPFPEYFNYTGVSPTNSQLVNTIQLFDDSSHPNVFGHSVIGETVCAEMGLAIQSKRMALEHDIQRSIQLEPGWKNALSGYEYVSSFWYRGDYVKIRLNIAKTDDTSFGDISNSLIGKLQYKPQVTTEHALVETQSNTPVLVGVLVLNTNGEIRITTKNRVRTTLLNEIIVAINQF